MRKNVAGLHLPFPKKKSKGNLGFAMPVFRGFRLVTVISYTLFGRFQILFCIDFSIRTANFENRLRGSHLLLQLTWTKETSI
jgi:hypothetical protein